MKLSGGGRGLAYMRFMPHSHTLTARVSTAWTISRPLGYMCAWEPAHGWRDHTLTAADAAAYQLSQPL